MVFRPYLKSALALAKEVALPELVAAAVNTREEAVLPWLALSLTPGLGPTRARRIVELFGTVAAVFRASLTELEATGMMASSAQALGTGKSLDLAREEYVRATAAGAQVVAIDDPVYPTRLKEITTHLLPSMFAEQSTFFLNRVLPSLAHAIPRPTAQACRRG